MKLPKAPSLKKTATVSSLLTFAVLVYYLGQLGFTDLRGGQLEYSDAIIAWQAKIDRAEWFLNYELNKNAHPDSFIIIIWPKPKKTALAAWLARHESRNRWGMLAFDTLLASNLLPNGGAWDEQAQALTWYRYPNQ